MKFSQDWDKLKDRVFATIRVHRGELRFVPDETVEVQSPKVRFRAKRTLVVSSRLNLVKAGMRCSIRMFEDLDGLDAHARFHLTPMGPSI